jgi:hypothetical protein
MIVSRCRTGDESALCALFGFNVRTATTHLRTVRRSGGTISSMQATARHHAGAICYMEKHTNFTQFPLKQNQTRSIAMPASRLPARATPRTVQKPAVEVTHVAARSGPRGA